MEENIINRQRYEALLRRIGEIDAQLAAVAQKPENRDYLITNLEMMQLLQLSKSTSIRWRRRGRLPFVRVEKKIYFQVDKLLELFERKLSPTGHCGHSPPREDFCPGDYTFMECVRCPLFVVLNSEVPSDLDEASEDARE